jgi:hypothetical protein
MQGTAFVQIDEIKESLNIRAVLPAAFPEPALERGAAVIVPPPFAHKFVPTVDLVFAGFSSLLKTPPEDLLVASPLVHPLDEGPVFHPKKRRALPIKADPEIGMVFRRELAFRVEPDFSQHSGEIEEVPGFFVGTEKGRVAHARHPMRGKRNAARLQRSASLYRAALVFCSESGNIRPRLR